MYVFMPVISFYNIVFTRHTLKAGLWKYCPQKKVGPAALHIHHTTNMLTWQLL